MKKIIFTAILAGFLSIAVAGCHGVGHDDVSTSTSNGGDGGNGGNGGNGGGGGSGH